MYLIVLITSISLVIGLNLIFNFAWMTLLDLLISFAIVLLPSLVCAIVIRLLPKKWFDGYAKVYDVSDREIKFLTKTKIKIWKEKIPNIAKIKYKNAQIEIDPKDPAFIRKLISETCYAESLHISCIITAVIAVLCTIMTKWFLTMTLPIGIVYICFNVPSILVQRFNRPRMKKQLLFLERQQGKK